MNQLLKQRIAQLKNSEIPTGYKKTELGIFPCDWEIVSIGSVSTNRGEYGLNAPARTKTDGLPKYIRITDIDENGNYVDNGACVDYNDTNGQYTLKPGDIVFARTGASVGRNYLYKIKDGDLVFAGFLIKFSVDEKVSNPYIVYTNCNTKTYHDWVKKISARSGQPGINAEEYCTYKFCKPKSLSEQAKIAEILMTWDKAIELYKQQIEKLKQFKSVCLKKMFPAKGQTVPEWRFKGFTGAWEQRKIEDCVGRIATGLNPRDNFKLNTGGTNYYVTIKNFEHGHLFLDDRCDKVDDDALKIIQERSDLQKDDILFTSIGRVGDCYLIESTPSNWNINESVFSLRPNQSVVIPEYLFQTIHCDVVLSQILNNITGSTFKSIKIGDLKKASIPVPNKEEQRKIGSFISNLDNLITLHQRKVETYQKQYRILQQYLLNGIVRVERKDSNSAGETLSRASENLY